MRYYKKLLQVLGRTPTPIEKEIFSVMWSEHCSYAHTKNYIAKLPKVGEGIGEDAGVVNYDDETKIAFKVESHNHPTALEPYNGAATGVGGIVRDVMVMGARPSFIFDSLHMDRINNRLVDGIADYANRLGIPVIGGDLRIHHRYRYNPIVNIMAVGIIRNKVIHSKVTSTKQVIVIFGGLTGKDGVYGASFASEDLLSEKASKHYIQVGDPFIGRLLMEAFDEMVREGLIEGAQDLGAGGLLATAAELASRGGFGVRVQVEKVPLREPLKPWEILLSESQERIAVVVNRSAAGRVLEIARKYLLDGAIVGEVLLEKVFEAYYGSELIVRLPIELLTNPPSERALNYMPDDLPFFKKDKSFIYEDPSAVYGKYDFTIGGKTILPPGFGTAVAEIGDGKYICGCLHSRTDLVLQNPYWGTYITVAECIRKILSTGGSVLGLTDCINYGDPDVGPAALAGIFYGLRDAANDFGVGVASGNASLYNTYKADPVLPTFVVGAVGKVEKPVFPKKGKIYAVGWANFSKDREKKLHEAIKRAVKNGAFVLTPSHFETLENYKKVFHKYGFILNIKPPEVEPAHQMVFVIGEIKHDIPVQEVGMLR